MMEAWTIYDHPSDFPNDYVARKHIIRQGETFPTDVHFADPDLDKVRRYVAGCMISGHCFRRSPDDDPVILETWL